MQNISWQYLGIAVKRVQIQSVDTDFREVTAIDLKVELPLIIDVPKDYPISNIQTGKSYYATIKVYKADTILRSRVPGSQTVLMPNPMKFELVGLQPNKTA